MTPLRSPILVLLLLLGLLGCEVKKQIQEKIQVQFQDEDGRTRLESRVWLPSEIKHMSQVIAGKDDEVWLVTSGEALYRVRPGKPAKKVVVQWGGKPVDVSWALVSGDTLWLVVTVNGRNVAGTWDRKGRVFRPLRMKHEPQELAWAQNTLWFTTLTGQLIRYQNGAYELQEAPPMASVFGAGSVLMAREVKGDRLVVRQRRSGEWKPVIDPGGRPVGVGPKHQWVQLVSRESGDPAKKATTRLVMDGQTLLSGPLTAAAVDGVRLLVIRTDAKGLAVEWRTLEMEHSRQSTDEPAP
jgi:hypothetical protein